MSLKNKTMAEANVWSLEITIDAATFKEALQKAYQKNKNRYNVPGFRRGKAPYAMITRYYGKESFYEDALELIYPETVEAAYKEGEIEAVSSPYDVDITTIGEDGVELSLKVAVKPEVALSDYKGISCEKEAGNADEEEINAEIDRMRERNSRIITVERPAEDGDIAVIDFEGFLDGTAFDGGKGEKYELTLGSGQFIPGFEPQIIGHSAGDSFDIDVSFPEEYGAENRAGKAVVFKIFLHELKKKELPELDDEFAKDLGEYETVAQLKEGVKADIEKRKQETADRNFESAVIEALAEKLEAEIPEVMFENKAKDNIQNFSQRLAQQGMKLETYLQYMGMEMEQYEQQMQEQAKGQVRAELALEKVAQLEKLEPAAEEIEAEYQKMAEQYNMELEKIKSLVAEKLVKEDLVRAAAVKFVVDNAKAKKPAAKKAAKKEPEAADDDAEQEKKAVKKPAAKKAAKAADADAVQEKPAKKPAAKKAAPKEESAES